MLSLLTIDYVCIEFNPAERAILISVLPERPCGAAIITLGQTISGFFISSNEKLLLNYRSIASESYLYTYYQA